MKRTLLGAVVVMLLSLQSAYGTFHLWQIDQIYSNASGTVQFIELFTTAAGQEHLGGHAISSNLNTFNLSDLSVLVHSTANQHMLIGTPGYSALSGVPAADFTVAANGFFNPAGDTINFAGVNSLTFGGVLPTDGTNALFRAFNSSTLTTGPNAPTDFAGNTGTVTLVPEPSTAVTLIAGMGLVFAAWRVRRQTIS